jgi:RimJ/RimL family protein N-acetyltransferase
VLLVATDEGGRVADNALRAAGCSEAFLFAHEQNERALHLYASAGYRPDGSIRESNFRGTRLRELRLVKRLLDLQAIRPALDNS